MKQKELSPTETPKELPPYEAPAVTTYREDDILAELGDARAIEPLSSVFDTP